MAQTLIQLGVDMTVMRTRRNLQAGLIEALRERGVRIIANQDR